MTDRYAVSLRLLFIAAVLFACARPVPAFAAAPPPLVITGAQDFFPLLDHCDAAPGNLGFDEIESGAAPFVRVDRVHLAGWPAVIWIRCRIQTANARDHREWLITMGNDVDHVDIYERSGQGYRMAITGMHVPYSQRTDHYVFPAFTLDDDALSGRPFYMHVTYFQTFPLFMSVRTEHRVLFRVEPYRVIEGLFFGVLLAVALFNLFVFFSMRDRSALIYVSYVAALFMNELVTTGIGDQYVWPNLAGDQRWLGWATETAAFGTALLFIRSFLQTRTALPGWDRALTITFFVEALTHLSIVLNPSMQMLVQPLVFFQLFAMLLTVATAVMRWRQGFAAARFYVIGFLPATVGIFANLAYNVYYNPTANWFWAANGVELGAMFQSVLISFSLLDRLRILDRQKEEARAELTVVSQEALRLHDLALHDPLTGLANRMLFTEELGRALLRANRKGTHVGVLFADLDGFKPINDIYGHRVGDQVLKIVADRLTETLRRADLTSRLGGDEFAIIVEDLKSYEQAEQICDTVGKLLEAPIVIDSTAMPLGISVGCAVFPQDGSSVDQLLHHADLRMYATKQAHKRGDAPAVVPRS